ncbi:hypothetical protein F5Y10DRAFT_232711 [Nemania abortiva]|nr:hypothetical protein F5Y10DRAFT_232711 [Nemania abortiva]
MGSMRLGGQNTATPAAARTNDSSKPQKISARNKTNPSPSLLKNSSSNKNNKNGNEINGDDTTTSAGRRTARSTTGERGQPIIRANKISAKRAPHITTISTTRNNNSGSGGSSRSVSGNTGSSRAPPAPDTPPIPTLSLPAHTTNPSTDDDKPVPLLSPPVATPIPIIITGAAVTTKKTRPRSRPLPSPPFVARRPPPLKLRDQNVAPVPAPVLKENRKMGHETSLNHSTTSTTNATATTTATKTQPQMPSLSATAARGINRTPLTPKIASAARPSQPQTPSLAAANGMTTPLPRRTQQRPVSTIIATTTGSNFPPYDDPNTVSAAAFSPHLNSNVTPRSGSRQSRVDSANSTPSGTPSHDRSDSWDAKAAFPFSSPLNQGDSSRRPVVTFSAISPERNASRRQDAVNPRDSKFFHASDAKTSRPTSASKMVSPKNPTFFYANGNGIASKSASPTTLSPPLSPGSNWSQENVSSKFMYANGTPELRPTPPPMVSHGSAASVPTTSKGAAGRSSAASQRPASPSKLPLHSPTYRNSIGSQAAVTSAAAAAALPARVPVSPPPPLLPSAPALRRSGTATSRSSGHSRSGSLAMVEAISEPSKPMASPTTGLFPPLSLSPTNTPPLTLAFIIQAAEDFAEAENDTSLDEQSVLQSPSKSTTSSVDPVTELIANARRERKVQDLQIRNTSLEAINRTLERQLRKQTAELRSYRRLSRSGHLSLASTAMSSRVTSGTMSEPDLVSSALSDLSEEDLSPEPIEEESFSDSDSAASDVSPSVRAEHDARHRHRDEERLKLDLSKHQQILVDSQKINQSIKRCLDWTEELIKDGKKALEYKVRVSDIQLGGRVLDPLDEEEDNSRLLPSDSTAALDLKPIEELLEKATTWGVESQDRDSGIELPKDGD